MGLSISVQWDCLFWFIEFVYFGSVGLSILVQWVCFFGSLILSISVQWVFLYCFSLFVFFASLSLSVLVPIIRSHGCDYFQFVPFLNVNVFCFILFFAHFLCLLWDLVVNYCFICFVYLFLFLFVCWGNMLLCYYVIMLFLPTVFTVNIILIIKVLFIHQLMHQ